MSVNKNHNKRYRDGKKNPQYRLTQTEADIVREYRRVVSEAEREGINPNDVKHGWIKSKKASLFFKNSQYRQQEKDKFFDEMLKTFSDHAPTYNKLEYNKHLENHLLVIDPADVHIGKVASEIETGQSYDSQEAVIRVIKGVNSILNKVQGFPINKICLVLGNDILHYDTPNKTTKGTQVDSDGLMWYECFLMAKRLYVEVIETLLKVAPVHCVFCPSNHDYQSGFFLAQLIETHFKNCGDISFDVSPAYRKYIAYENNLLGFSHRDKGKANELPLIMATECPHLWAKCNRRYIYLHHFHSKRSNDIVSVCVETMRSPSPPDSWHHSNGYLNLPAIEGFIHHPTGGQIARITHFF